MQKLSYLQAKELILSLSREYNEQRQSRKASESAPAPVVVAEPVAVAPQAPTAVPEPPSALVAALVPPAAATAPVPAPVPQEASPAAVVAAPPIESSSSEELTALHEPLAMILRDIGGPNERSA